MSLEIVIQCDEEHNTIVTQKMLNHKKIITKYCCGDLSALDIPESELKPCDCWHHYWCIECYGDIKHYNFTQGYALNIKWCDTDEEDKEFYIRDILSASKQCIIEKEEHDMDLEKIDRCK